MNAELSVAGYDVIAGRVQTAVSLKQALESKPWDVILCNHNIPGFDAFSALSVLDECEADIPFIVISGTTDERAGVATMKAGAHDYFQRNDLARLAQTVEHEIHDAENRHGRKQAEAALKTSEKELRVLFSAMTDVVMELDSNGRYLKIAPGSPQALYRPQSELIGKTLHEVFPQADADFFLEEIGRALSSAIVHRVEYSLELEGKAVWFEGSVSRLSKDSVVWIARDITKRRTAEVNLRESERRLAEAQSLTKLGSWELNLEDNKLIWSDELYRVYGVEPGGIDLSYRDVVDAYVHPDDRKLVTETVTHSIASHEPFGFYYRIIRPDEQVRIVHSRGSVYLNAEGKPVRMFGTAQDVTEKRHGEQEQSRLTAELKTERERLSNIVASVPGVVWEAWGTPNEATQHIDFISDYSEPLLGYSSDEWLSTPNFWLSIVHPDDRERVGREAAAIYAEGGEGTVEFRWVKKNGDALWVESRFNILTNDEGVSIGMLGVSIDISKRKKAQNSLREQKEILQQIFDNIPVMISFFGPDGRPVLVNREWERVRGWTQEEAVSPDLDILAESYPDPVERQRAREAIMDPTGEWAESRTVSKDGLVIDCMSAVVRMSDGTSLGIAQEVGDRKRAEEALRDSEQELRQGQKMEAVGRLAGGIAHDFNNLLTAVTGYSELALRRLSLDDPLRRNCEEIKRAGERAASLTRQLLAFSRKQILQPKILDLNTIVSDMESMLHRLIGEDIELCTAPDPDAGNVKADPGQIEQVIMNLVVNARDAMPRGGSIVIETQNVRLGEKYIAAHQEALAGNYLMLAISDTGTGMDDETKSQIFDPFFTTKPLGEGTGLGLSTVYGIVNQSDGYIEVYSELGLGTTFKIYLPRVDTVRAEAQGIVNEIEDLSGNETILLAEDEEAVRNLSREVLATQGYNVITASNGADALSVSDQHDGEIHLLISDVVMPEMGGRDLQNKLLSSRPDIKVLFMSGYTDDAIVRHGVFESGTPFLQKPFTPDVLSRKVRDVLGPARLLEIPIC